jgi:hypothetical protein
VFSTSLRVESHDIGVPLEEVMPSLPMAQQKEAQGGVEDEEEEEENDFLDILTGVEDDALPADCNIVNDQYGNLFGHQEEYLENLRGRSSSPTNNLWLNTPAANSAAAAANVVASTVAAAAISAITSPDIATNTTTTEEEAAVPAKDAEEDDSPTVENPGLNTGGGARRRE